MRLISKKCPNCGAALGFKKTDSEVTCDYCKQSFLIEGHDIGERIIDPDAIRDISEVAKTGLVAFGAMNIVSGVIFVAIFLIVVIGMIFGMVSFKNHFFPEEKIEEKNDDEFNLDYINSADYISDLSQLDEETLLTLAKESVGELTTYTYVKGYTGGNWVFVGRYLLNSKKSQLLNVNNLYEVYRREYTGENGSVKVGYAAVKYTDIVKLYGKIIVPVATLSSFCPTTMVDVGTDNYIYGYESIESLYNTLIKDKQSSYDIKASTGMYVG